MISTKLFGLGSGDLAFSCSSASLAALASSAACSSFCMVQINQDSWFEEIWVGSREVGHVYQAPFQDEKTSHQEHHLKMINLVYP